MEKHGSPEARIRIGPYLMHRRNFAGGVAGLALVLAGLALTLFSHGIDGDCRVDNPLGCSVADLDRIEGLVNEEYQNQVISLRKQVRGGYLSQTNADSRQDRFNEARKERLKQLRQSRRSLAGEPGPRDLGED